MPNPDYGLIVLLGCGKRRSITCICDTRVTVSANWASSPQGQGTLAAALRRWTKPWTLNPPPRRLREGFEAELSSRPRPPTIRCPTGVGC